MIVINGIISVLQPRLRLIFTSLNMDYYHDFWVGFLSEQIARQTVEMAITKCPGCEDKMNSPLLHSHHQLSLLDKLRCYFEEIRGSILPTIDALYEQYKEKLPHSDDLDKDKEIYLKNGRFFLISITAEALYYGRYLNEMNDSYINEGFTLPKKRKITKAKKPIKITPKLL